MALVYTLKPGMLGQNRVDEFFFQSKQGFCEHYASSFALLMRYVGIPARVVVGYQGGNLHPMDKAGKYDSKMHMLGQKCCSINNGYA